MASFCGGALAHHSVLARHASPQGAFQLGTESELLENSLLVRVELDALLAQALVALVQALNGLANVLDLGNGAVTCCRGLDSRSSGIDAVAHRRAGGSASLLGDR